MTEKLPAQSSRAVISAASRSPASSGIRSNTTPQVRDSADPLAGRRGDTRGIDAQHAARLRWLLTTLNRSVGPAGINPPGYRLHQLKGEREGQWAVSASGNWRLVFEFEGDDATNVDLVDYH